MYIKKNKIRYCTFWVFNKVDLIWKIHLNVQDTQKASPMNIVSIGNILMINIDGESFLKHDEVKKII